MRKKEANGITLIALVITIIVLLILAGISIATLIGDNGILSNARKAKEEARKAELKEELEVEITNIQANKKLQGKNMEREDLKELSQIGALVETTGIPAEGEYKEYFFEVDENYKVKILDKITEERFKIKGEVVTEGVVEQGGTVEIKITATKGTIKEVEATNGAIIKSDISDTEKLFTVTENGIYYFEATSNSGKVQTTEVEVNTIKEKPKIEIEQVSDESFTIKVSNNYKEGLVTEYKYYVEGEIKNSGTLNKEYTISGLAEDTQYNNIYVGANFETEELISEKTSVKTKEEEIKVNAPKIEGTGLIPIKIENDGSSKEIQYDDESWYDYAKSAKKWANAKTADGSMWVWIPRFAYKITYNNVQDKSQGGTIDIVFLKGTTSLDAKDRDVTNENYVDAKGVKGAYIVHPVFKDGNSNGFSNGEWDKEITGFWMAKFEAGYAGTQGKPETAKDSPVKYTSVYAWWGNGRDDIYNIYYGERDIGTAIKYPTFQANRASMEYISIRDIYDLSRNLTASGNPYNLKNVDSHMTKNSEWGAVAYLTHSKFGRNGENVTINNVLASDYAVTGYAAGTVNAALDDSRTLDQLLRTGQTGSWTTERGKKASTTGNIFGIYDLNGGALEYVAGYVVGGDWYNDYGGELKGNSTKYKTKYEGTSTSSETNYNKNSTKKGEAIWETSSAGSGNTSWLNCESIFCNSGGMGNFMVRGRRRNNKRGWRNL